MLRKPLELLFFVQSVVVRLLIVATTFYLSANAADILNRHGEVVENTITNDQVRRLSLQHWIDRDLNFSRALFIGTHNSYSSKRYGDLVYVNQRNDVTAQLNAGARVINLDLFSDVLSPDEDGTDTEVCHTNAITTYFGCESGYRLYPILAEIRDWFSQHPDEVIVVAFEEFLVERGFTTDEDFSKYAANLLINPDYLGDLYLKPSAEHPDFSQLSKKYIRSRGKNVVFVCSYCARTDSLWDENVYEMEAGALAAKADAWVLQTVDDVTDRYSILYENRCVGCGGASDEVLDSSELSAALHQRPYNMLGLDSYIAEPRFEAMIWSWGENYPRTIDNCVISDDSLEYAGRVDRWRSENCIKTLPLACAPGLSIQDTSWDEFLAFINDGATIEATVNIIFWAHRLSLQESLPLRSFQ